MIEKHLFHKHLPIVAILMWNNFIDSTQLKIMFINVFLFDDFPIVIWTLIGVFAFVVTESIFLYFCNLNIFWKHKRKHKIMEYGLDAEIAKDFQYKIAG